MKTPAGIAKFFLIFSLLVSGSSFAHPPSAIYGHLTDSITQVALTRVQVEFIAHGSLVKEVLSDDNGDYDSGTIPSDTYQVNFRLAGYQPLLNVPISAPPGGEIQVNEALISINPGLL